MEREEADMARIEGIDPQGAPFLMRQVFKRVRKNTGLGPHAAKNRSPSATGVLGKLAGGMAFGTESGGPATAAHAIDTADRSASWLSLLNRCEFCRRQSVRVKRRGNNSSPRRTDRRVCAVRGRFAPNSGRHGRYAVKC